MPSDEILTITPSRSGTQSDPNIDGGWGWVVVFITFMIRVILDGFVYTFGIFYVEHLEYYNTTGGAASLVMSILIGVTHLAGPIASGLVNKFGCRFVSFLGTALACLGLLLSLPVPAVEYLYLTIGIITGIGCGLVYLPTIVGVALHFEKKRAFAMGISMSGSGIAMTVFAPLVEWLIKYYHYWKGALLIIIGILMNCFVLTFFYKTYTPAVLRPVQPSTSTEAATTSTTQMYKTSQTQTHSKDLQNPKDKGAVQEIDSNGSNLLQETSTSAHLSGIVENRDDIFFSGSSTSLLNLPQQLRSTSQTHNLENRRRGAGAIFKDIVSEMVGTSLLKNYAFLIFSLGTFLHYFGLTAPIVYLYHKAVETGIATPAKASFLLSLEGLANMFGKIIIGYWADRTSVTALTIYAVCLLITGIATMMMSLSENYFQLVLCILVYGTFWGGSITLSSIVMVNLFGLSNLSNAYGLFLLFIGVSTVVGTPLTGVFHDLTKSYDAGFYLSGAVIFIGSLLLFFIPAVQRRFPQQL